MADGTPVLNALNTRYVVLGADYPPLVNEAAFGPAWFVDSVVEAAGPDEESALLGQVDLRRQAVVESSFATAVMSDSPVILSDSEESDFIEMTSYAPNELHYKYSASSERLAVFSEIYYPDGWTLTLLPSDGSGTSAQKQIPLLRADWTLRAALLPAGEHELVMTFLPESYRTGALVSRIASIGLLLLLLLSVGLAFFSARKNK